MHALCMGSLHGHVAKVRMQETGLMSPRIPNPVSCSFSMKNEVIRIQNRHVTVKVGSTRPISDYLCTYICDRRSKNFIFKKQIVGKAGYSKRTFFRLIFTVFVTGRKCVIGVWYRQINRDIRHKQRNTVEWPNQ
jgi:hypothetical protein